MISGGVLSSCPSQNGQRPPSVCVCDSVLKSCGRFARSCAMITQRPTIGSFRSSGMLGLPQEGVGLVGNRDRALIPHSILKPRSPKPTPSNLPHDPLKIGTGDGQFEDPLARGTIEAGIAAEDFNIEADRVA